MLLSVGGGGSGGCFVSTLGSRSVVSTDFDFPSNARAEASAGVGSKEAVDTGWGAFSGRDEPQPTFLPPSRLTSTAVMSCPPFSFFRLEVFIGLGRFRAVTVVAAPRVPEDPESLVSVLRPLWYTPGRPF